MKNRTLGTFLRITSIVGVTFLTSITARAVVPALATAPAAGNFDLVAPDTTADIFVDPSAPVPVVRAVGDLAADVRRVTGRRPKIIRSLADAGDKPVVIIGVIGRNHIIDTLASSKKLNLSGIRGQWESHVAQTVDHPLPGVASALVIAGSDPRGTIYGIYDLSEAIGVSPWYWWADVPVRHRDTLFIHAGTYKEGPPAVKYRGIFINDEDWGLQPWAAKTFEPETGDIGPKTYAKVFELLLRLHANYIWPAMHPCTHAFNYYPNNKLVAAEYGIVMGSSHAEPMLRDNVDEWKRDGHGKYDFVTNPKGVLDYWEARVKSNARFENIYTVGMRGIGDSGMQGGGTLDQKAARLSTIITDQRNMLRRWVNPDPAKVPQLFCPYKEVLAIYHHMAHLPDDITLLWPDDNYGYVRQFPNPQERLRSGGSGVYYHISYWGRPYDYLWIYSTPPALIWEEMTKAYDYGARNVWVVNVGDIKPGERGMEFFLDLAWNPRRWQRNTVNHFLLSTARRDFGPEHAKEIASIMADYFRLNFPRKPEHMGLDPSKPLMAKPVFSVTANGDEAARRLKTFTSLAARASALEAKLPANERDAYFELVLYPVRCAALANAKGLNYGRYLAYEKEGRASAGRYLKAAHKDLEQIHKMTAYFNHGIKNGKWLHVISDHPRNLPVFGLPKSTPVPVPAKASLGVLAEDSSVGASEPTLPAFTSLLPEKHFIDVFDRGSVAVNWHAKPSADWIQLNKTQGTGDARLWVGIDWAKAPASKRLTGSIEITGAGSAFSVELTAYRPDNASAAHKADFCEAGGRFVIEAEHPTRNVSGQTASWKRIDGIGYDGHVMAPFPRTASPVATPSAIEKKSPCLEYTVWIQTPGNWDITTRLLPAWSVVAGRAPRYAIAVDNETPQIVSLPRFTNEHNPEWQKDVLRNAILSTSNHAISKAGIHTVKIWMVDSEVSVDAIMGRPAGSHWTAYTWPRETRIARH